MEKAPAHAEGLKRIVPGIVPKARELSQVRYVRKPSLRVIVERVGEKKAPESIMRELKNGNA